MKKFLILFILLITIFLNTPFFNILNNKITSIASNKANLNIKINKIEHTFLNPNMIKLNRISVKNKDRTILEIESLSLKLELLPLIDNIVNIDFINIDQLKTSLIKEDFSLKNKKETAVEKNNKPISVNIKKIKVNHSEIKYDKFLLEKINLESSFSNNKINIKSLIFNTFGANLDIKGNVNLTNKNLKLSGSARNFELSNLNDFLNKKDLKLKGKIKTEFKIDKDKTINGNLKIEGHKLKLKGIDLDKLINGFMDSQEVGLFDIASYMTLGPLGMIFTNSLEAVKSIPGLSGQSTIKHLNINTKIDNSILKIKDVGFSSKENRIIAQGKIDLNQLKFNNFKVHVLNDNACSRFHQEIKGKLTRPEIGATKTISSGIISPITDLIKKTSNIFSDCSPIYSGKIKHP